jgi:hypothetical protein
MHRLLVTSLALSTMACGGSSFDIVDEQGGVTDTGASSAADSAASDDTASAPADSGTAPDDTGVTPAMDTAPPADTGPAPCGAPEASATDVYVDGSVATSGKGSMGCPVKTILEAIAIPRAATVARTIHVAAGSYAESDVVSVTGTTTLRGEGTGAKLTGGSKAACAPTPDKCVVRMEGAATVEGFTIDASGVTLGVVMAGGSPRIRNSTVKNAARDGVHVANGGELGPEIHVDDNGWSGVVVRGGNLKVAAGANTFDRNKGVGMWVGSTYTPAGGVVIYGSSTLEFGGGSASGNQIGVMFDWGSSSTANQTINKLVAKNNRSGGVSVPHNQKAVVIRDSVLTKNTNYGLWFEYSSAGNKLDIGSGNNVFGGASEKNGKVGIYLCRSGATGSQPGDSNAWSVCPPVQTQVSNCDSWPSSYADVAYVPSSTITTVLGANPVTNGACKVGP